jgi:hypothetical protein
MMRITTICILVLNLFICCQSDIMSQTAISDQNAFMHELTAKNDFDISPYTGYTRAHWLEITEKIIAGVLPHLDKETGIPELHVDPLAYGFANTRFKKWEEVKKRKLERIMMAVVIYTTATGKDQVPGFDGSISTPFIRAITKGTDPKDPDYWGNPEDGDQVGSLFALAIYLNPELFWEPLSEKQKHNLLRYFEKQAYAEAYDNNHYFFHMVAVPLLEQHGYHANRKHYTKMFRRLLGWYRGDGWFIDGENQGFDYYNFWGFHLFFQILTRYDTTWNNMFADTISAFTRRFQQSVPYFFDADGAPIPYGRSLCYRFALNSAIAWPIMNHCSTLPAGQARRIASGCLKYFWENGCLDKDGILSIGFRGTNASVAESYIAPGDQYWAIQGLACLLIPGDHPFWTHKEEPIPADRNGGILNLPGPQFTINVSPDDGEARLFPVGQPFYEKKFMGQSSEKYDQHSYSSYLGFCAAGDGSEEIGQGRTGYSYDGEKWHYRAYSRVKMMDSSHLLSAYKLNPNPQSQSEKGFTADEMITHTLIGKNGELHIFWHNCPEPLYMHLGGYGIQVPHGTEMTKEVKDSMILIHGGNSYSLLKTLYTPAGTFEGTLLKPRPGWVHTHLFGGLGAFPKWFSNQPVPPNTPLVIYVDGSREHLPEIPHMQIEKARDHLNIEFGNEQYTINIPY